MIDQAEAKVLFESDRFQAKFIPEPNSGCWIWTGPVDTYGYGNIRPTGGVTTLAYKVAYIAEHGPVPDGLELDHLCKMRQCINPEHLEPVTHSENVRRGRAGSNMRDKTHCIHGHEYTPENTLVQKGKYRLCKICNREQVHKWYLEHRKP